ncbi:substrate-binding domain-containing protein [Ancylobacter pratisalsi]|uniref:Substrate-binding domain-containing protein n=1 Tax=Ancylobacter pratisalsi TaxID=1745854 RepID=A0A6P1YNE9_9HYPH|nr:substrate-binding domain-containing protein [Ancylobacter pratisalsi]QIB34582.1 substrate-binding domain-containing protein [Ancylobacter pratisalsi]
MNFALRASRNGARRVRSAAFAMGAAALATGLALPAHAETRAKPFDAWPKSEIMKTMSLDEAKAIVAARTGPQTEWKGPTTGPEATTAATTVVYVSADQSYVSFVNWGRGVSEAAEALGWKAVTLNGKGTVTGNLSAMQQAVAMKPAAIVTSADASALQGPIKQAVDAGIPVIGIHATAFPGPDPETNLFMNIGSDPVEIGAAQAAYVIAKSNGTARLLHFLDSGFAIARLKAEAATEPVKNCKGCTFLEMINIPIADQTRRIPSVISGVIANYGDDWWGTTCCDNFYPYIASALRASGVEPSKVHLVGADGPPSAYDMIRKGEYEVATVPEPSTLFGYQAIDAVVRAMAGEEPAKFVQPTYLVTRENVDKEGGDKNEFIPSNGFACHYMNVWRKTAKAC